MKKVLEGQKFIIGWILYIVLSLIQATFMDIHYDEAYYWVYSRFLSWGYFDHPPMVALVIFLGTKLFGGFLGLRFFFVVLSSISFLVLWQMVKTYFRNAYIFWLMVFSISLWLPYTLFALPDIPLFFFTVLFLWLYKKYLENKSWLIVFALALAIAGMIYSKYHAVLVLLFIFISNWKLIREKTAWALVVLVAVLMLPHAFWQIENQFPTFKYHLVDSHQTSYKVEVTINYIASAILLTGPLLGWLFLFSASKYSPKNTWEKGLKWLFGGVFLFFLAASFVGDSEAHWPLVAYIPMFILAYIYFGEQPRWYKTIKILGVASFVLVLITRVFLIVSDPNDSIKPIESMFGWEKEVNLLKSEAGERPIVFQDAYQKAGRYAFFANRPFTTHSLNSCFNRYNQYDIYPIEETIQGKDVLLATTDSLQADSTFYVLEGKKKTWYLRDVDNFRSFNLLKLNADTGLIQVKDKKLNLSSLEIKNTYEREIKLEGNPDLPASLQCYVKSGKVWKKVSELELDDPNLLPNEVIEIKDINFHLPDTLSGSYFGRICFQNGPFKPIHSCIAFDLKID